MLAKLSWFVQQYLRDMNVSLDSCPFSEKMSIISNIESMRPCKIHQTNIIYTGYDALWRSEYTCSSTVGPVIGSNCFCGRGNSPEEAANDYDKRYFESQIYLKNL